MCVYWRYQSNAIIEFCRLLMQKPVMTKMGKPSGDTRPIDGYLRCVDDWLGQENNDTKIIMCQLSQK